MTLTTSVIDSADWHLAVPLAAQPGEIVDFSGTLLTIALTPILGGEPIATADSDAGTLVFVPAAGNVPAYFALDLRVKDRTWRVGRPTKVVGDILRHPDPAFPLYIEWLGRVSLTVLPGSNSAGIGAPAFAPVLTDAQPYDARIVATPMLIGPQGASGAPTYQAVTVENNILAIDLNAGAYARAALSELAELVLTGWPTNFEMGRLTVELDIAPGATVTSYPAGTLWSSGAPPVLSPGPAKDILMFTSIDGGLTVFGHIVGQSYR